MNKFRMVQIGEIFQLCVYFTFYGLIHKRLECILYTVYSTSQTIVTFPLGQLMSFLAPAIRIIYRPGHCKTYTYYTVSWLLGQLMPFLAPAIRIIGHCKTYTIRYHGYFCYQQDCEEKGLSFPLQ